MPPTPTSDWTKIICHLVPTVKSHHIHIFLSVTLYANLFFTMELFGEKKVKKIKIIYSP